MRAKLPDSETPVNRRRAMQLGVGAAAVAVGAGGVAADEGDNTFAVDTTADGVHDLVIDGEITVEEHDGAVMDVLGYTADDETPSNLEELGIVPRPLDEDEEAQHWIEMHPSRIYSPKYLNFPRGESYEDEDEEVVEVSWSDPEHWSDPADLTEEDNGIRFAPGATSTFESTDDFDVEVSNSLSKYLFLVADIDQLGVVSVTLTDDEGAELTVTADAAGDSADDDIVATEPAEGVIYQTQIGDLTEDFGTIESVTVDVDADSEIVLYGLDVEESSKVTFGTEEYLDEDGDLDTREVEESDGGLLELSDITTGRFVNDTIEDLTYLVEQRSSELDEDHVFGRMTDADLSRFDQPVRMEIVYSMEFPDGFYFDSSVESAYIADQRYSSSRYRDVSRVINEDIESIEDWDDVSDSAVDITSRFDDVGEEITVYDSMIAGDELTLGMEYLVSESMASDHELGAIGGVGISGGEGFLSGPRGLILAISGILGAWAARTRGLFGG